VRQGLTSAAPFMRRRIADRLRLKSTPALAFEVDRVFEQEAHIDELLRQVSEAASENVSSEAASENVSSEAASENVSQDKSKKPD